MVHLHPMTSTKAYMNLHRLVTYSTVVVSVWITINTAVLMQIKALLIPRR